MFNNVGAKIKSIAFYAGLVGIAVSTVVGFMYMTTDDDLFLIGLLFIVAGSLFSWIGGLFLYGFGKIVENSDIIVKHIVHQEYSSVNDSKTEVSDVKMGNANVDVLFERVKALRDKELAEIISSNEYPADFKEICERELKSRLCVK